MRAVDLPVTSGAHKKIGQPATDLSDAQREEFVTIIAAIQAEVERLRAENALLRSALSDAGIEAP